jgi:hypothetical protein
VRAALRGALPRLLPATAVATAVAATGALDLDAYWAFNDPAQSEVRSRQLLARTQGGERLEVLIQIARTDSLGRDFSTAHRRPDEVEGQLAAAIARASAAIDLRLPPRAPAAAVGRGFVRRPCFTLSRPHGATAVR